MVWGSSWIAIHYQLGNVPPEASITYRFALAAFVSFFYCYFRKLSLKFSIQQYIVVIIFGLVSLGCNYYFLYLAQNHINSALASIAFSTLMLSICAFGIKRRFHDKYIYPLPFKMQGKTSGSCH
jgi:drug/metabolite transporter (DMT)-like permease